jgi:hypothetical protein
MAQTTNGISFKANKIEISTDGVNFTDMSGFGVSLDPSGGERGVGEEFTWDGDTPILVTGKRGALEIKAKIVYTEGIADPFRVVRAAYEAGSDLYLRWSPKGGSAGQRRYTTTAAKVVECPPPGGEAGAEDVVLCEFTVKCADLVAADI